MSRVLAGGGGVGAVSLRCLTLPTPARGSIRARSASRVGSEMALTAFIASDGLHSVFFVPPSPTLIRLFNGVAELCCPHRRFLRVSSFPCVR